MDENESVEARLERLQESMNTLSAQVGNVLGRVNFFMDKLEPHLDEIGGYIEQIANHPMMKMLGVKKRS